MRACWRSIPSRWLVHRRYRFAPFQRAAATSRWIGSTDCPDNSLMTRHLLASCAVVALGYVAAAQEMRFLYPGASAVGCGRFEGTRRMAPLQMDVYRPRNAGGKTLPVLVFFNIATGAQRSNTFYRSWAEIAASHDLVAIIPDLRSDSFESDLDALLTHLTAQRCESRRRPRARSPSTRGPATSIARFHSCRIPRRSDNQGRGDVLRRGRGERHFAATSRILMGPKPASTVRRSIAR